MAANPFDPSLFIPLFLVAVLVSFIAQKLRVPYPVALVCAGLFIGASHLLPQARLQPHTLLTLFLPPLLFKTALLLKFSQLKTNLKPIAIYTIGATIFSALFIALALAYFLHLPFSITFVFGSLISATDPIAVIAIFQKLGAPARLTLLIESESLFNDGIAAVLFITALQIALGHTPTVPFIALQLGSLLVGGLLVGAAAGLVASHLHSRLDDHLVELMLTTILAFGTYLLADRLHASGVVAVVTAGLVVGNIGTEAMSPTTKEAVRAFWEYAEFVVNSLVFLLIGAELAQLHWHHIWRDALLAPPLVLLSRLVVYPLSYIGNRLKADIPIAWQHILWWGGLRGALSMALALSLPPHFPWRNLLIGLTFSTVSFSILVQGITIYPLLKRLLPINAASTSVEN